MDLWIRSQDKTRLSKINSLQYGEYQGAHYINGYCINEVDNIDLGIYATKERALEILDEIHERIMIMNTFKLIGIQNEKIAMSFLSVFNEEKLKGIAYPYEMPKE